ncbi:TonB-dependent receptor [Escherichia coli]|nr:TonB-dependent receptor [Escherichia coli]
MAPSAPSKVATRWWISSPATGDENFSLQGNVNNLFDKTYDTNVEGSIVYGAPRNFSITGTYQF